ncbi:hypothetical protein WJX72_007619 [[Myrmecia] bisecta]|uniref:Uncharacterized protein n=1 Tax=[Myrmecia] bisecta TaxID=41462 RepID=A0AAW1Q174_9CHLO
MASAGACIIRRAAQAQQLVDTSLIEAAGYKLRTSSTILPDLSFNRAGSSMAIIILGPQPVHAAETNSDIMTRLEKLGGNFQHAFVIVDAASSFYDSEDMITTTAGLSHLALCRPPEVVLGFGAQQQASLQSSAVLNHTLMSIPGLQLTEHHANALRMLGSLQQLAQASADDILEATDLDDRQ